jgi:hypothetical protein
MTSSLPSKASRILLWLWIINLGIALGAGLYESRIVLPDWLYRRPDGAWFWDAAAARHSATGLRFWAFVSTGPLTLLTLANAAFGFRAPSPLRRGWVGIAFLGAIERMFTFGYFIPTMLRLLSGDLSQQAAVDLARQWQALDHLRHALLAVVLLGCLRVFAQLHVEVGKATTRNGKAAAAAGEV